MEEVPVSAVMSSCTNNNTSTTSNPMTTTPFLHALLAGGIAGTSVDVALFPIDTIKTRLQSPQGFVKAGGFRGIYNGLGAAAIGSAPGAALFFCTYESMKPILLSWQRRNTTTTTGFDAEAWSHMAAASLGEAAACLVRVPTEVIKTRLQTTTTTTPTTTTTTMVANVTSTTGGSSSSSSSIHQSHRLVSTVSSIVKESHGPMSFLFGGLYRGYGTTLLREIPFAMIQFPLYEQFKVWCHEYHVNQRTTQNQTSSSSLSSSSSSSSSSPENMVSSLEAATCGSISGGIAAALTTPLDVIKTRLMVGQDQYGQLYNHGTIEVIQRTYRQDGIQAFWRGIQPRVVWISIGGFVFFGAYETSKSLLHDMLPPPSAG